MAHAGLATRLATALVLLPASLALVLIPELRWGFVLFVAVLTATAMFEYARMIQAKRFPIDAPLCIGSVALMSVLAGQGNPELVAGVFLLLTLIVVASLVIQGKATIASLGASVFGLVYLGWFPAHLVILHGNPDGAVIVVLLYVAVILTDAGAYFVGKQFGKHKLAPKVSPNKTWEGAIGGVLCAVVGMVAFKYGAEYAGARPLPIAPLLLIGAVLSVTSQIGDLAESALKRDAGVKDAGTIFPGHGGVLDRCDGFLFASPVLYYMTSFF